MFMLIFTETYESEVGDTADGLIEFGDSAGRDYIIIDVYNRETVYDSTEVL
jgi:hypothetical protein